MQNFKTSDLDASNSPQVNPSPVVEAELPTPVVAQVVRRKSRLTIRGIVGWCWRTFKSIVEALFGMLSLIVLLSVAATIPILQFLSLGYLLEAAARIARDGGRIRDGFVGIRQAARIGGAALGTWFLLQPLRFVIDLRREAVLFRDSQLTEGGWNVAFAATAFLIVGQIVWALFRGGRLRSFFWPAPWKLVRRIRQGMFGTGGMYQQARDGLSDFVTQMNLQHYFWLGLRGFVVAVTWLALPVSMFVLASRLPSNGIAVLLSLLLIVGQIVRVRIRGGRWPNFRRSAPVKLRHLIWWGIRGLWVTFTWVVLPFLVFVLVSNSPHEIASLWMSLLGGLLLSIVVLYLPYLQIN